MNPEAATRSFKITAEVVSTTYITGMVGLTPVTFDVNLICTLNSLTLTGTAAYCHAALSPTYAPTSLIQPTWVADPTDCPNFVPVFTLVKSVDESAYDPALISEVSAPPFAVDTTDPLKTGTYGYRWKLAVPTTAILVGTSAQQDISISVTGCVSTSMAPSPAGPENFDYVINPTTSTPQTFMLPTYVFASLACANPYDITVIRTDNTPIPFAWG